jgi:hypothetical protein
VQDHLTGLNPGSVVRWGFITKGQPDSLAGPAVTLHAGKKSLVATRLSPDSSQWETFESAKPPHEWDTPNPKTCILGFNATAPASGELSLAVLLTPGSRLGQTQVKTISLRNPETW